MKQKAYRQLHGLTQSAFGRLVGARQEQVRRWELPVGDCWHAIPRVKYMLRIIEATAGRVTANDYYEPAAATAEAAA